MEKPPKLPFSDAPRYVAKKAPTTNLICARASSRRVRATVLALALAVIAAGCVGKRGDEPTAEPASTVDVADGPALDVSQVPGAIRGVVLTRELTPIAGATVKLLRENVSIATGALGTFAFDDLKNGRYLVRAEKAGWYGKTAAATVRNGTVYQLNFTLDPVPVIVPYQETVELRGMLACEGRLVTPTGPAPVACGDADPNLKREWEVDVNAGGLIGLVVEEVWDPGTPAANRLNLTLETVGYGSSDLTLAAAEVADGYGRLVVTGAVLQKYYPAGGTTRVKTTIATAGTGAPIDGGMAVQQPVTVYVTAFYHALPPDGFTIVQGG